jgi:hypothetical protein
MAVKAFLMACAAMLALTACAAPSPSARGERAPLLLTVSVDPVLETAATPTLAQHQSGAAMPGVPPETLAGLDAYMQQHAISVGQIVHRVFAHQIALHPDFRARMLAHDGAARFRIRATWGLAQESFGPAYHPLLQISAELVTDGRVVWRNQAAITAQTESVGGRTWPELFASPQVLQAMYSSAARQIVARLLLNV